MQEQEDPTCDTKQDCDRDQGDSGPGNHAEQRGARGAGERDGDGAAPNGGPAGVQGVEEPAQDLAGTAEAEGPGRGRQQGHGIDPERAKDPCAD